MFLCSALGVTILFCFPVFLVLVEFWFSTNIFCVLFSLHCFCLLTAVETATEIIHLPLSFGKHLLFSMGKTHSFSYSCTYSGEILWIMQCKNHLLFQLREFLRCENQLLRQTQEPQEGLPGRRRRVQAEHLFQPAHGRRERLRRGLAGQPPGCWFCTSGDHSPAASVGRSALRSAR